MILGSSARAQARMHSSLGSNAFEPRLERLEAGSSLGSSGSRQARACLEPGLERLEPGLEQFPVARIALEPASILGSSGSILGLSNFGSRESRSSLPRAWA